MVAKQSQDSESSYMQELQSGNPEFFFNATQSALETMSKLNKLTYNFALNYNRALTRIYAEQWRLFAGLPRRLAECRTPDDVVETYADVLSEGTHKLNEGFDQLAASGVDAADKAKKAAAESRRVHH
jgi:hypothetical protein